MAEVNEMESLPEGWRRVRLGKVIEESKRRNTDGKERPVLSISNIYGFILQNEYFSHNIHSRELSKYKIVYKNYFAYNPARINVGSIALNENFEEGLLSPMYVVFKTKKNLCPKYLSYFIQTYLFKTQVLNNVAGSVRESLNYSSLELFDFYFPESLSEQRKIAEILETIDNAIEKTDQIIEKYKRIKQGLMQELLTKGIDENGQIRSEKTHKFKDSPLGRIPEEWEVVELGEVGEIVSGSTPDTSNSEFWNGDIIWITPDDLSKLNTRYIYNSKRNITEKGLKNCSAELIPPNSIVISSRAPIGYLAVSKVRFATNQGCKSIILNRNNDPDFFYYCLHMYIKKMISLGSGTTFSEISKSDLENMKICIPKLKSEQQRIASILSQIDEVIEKEQKYKQKLERIKRGLMEDLLTGKVRVNCLVDKEVKGSEC